MMYKPKANQGQQPSEQQTAAEEVKQAQPVNPEQTAVPQISFAPMNPNLANNPDFQELMSAMQPPLLAQNSGEQKPSAA